MIEALAFCWAVLGAVARADWIGADGRRTGRVIHLPAHVAIWLDAAGTVVAKAMNTLAAAAPSVWRQAVPGWRSA